MGEREGAAKSPSPAEVLKKEVLKKLRDGVSDPDSFQERLYAHFRRMPPSYMLNVTVDKAAEVIIHMDLLDRAVNELAYEIRFVESIDTDTGSQKQVFSHEVIFSSVDEPKLLIKLSVLLSEIGLTIREAHVFTTTDGFSLDVFVVNGCPDQNTGGLYAAMELALEFSEVEHRNVIKFFGARTESPFMCIVTEYMPGGSLYDYLHDEDKNKIIAVPQLLEFAIDVSKGMEYLHQENIIHRDLKTKNLWLDANCYVVKVADFGDARFLNRMGHMIGEIGTYKWMDPVSGLEIMTHKPCDEKADVYSFGIVLWELMTRENPYSCLTPPIQAAFAVGKGKHPEIPENAHPGLPALMQRCWDAAPTSRPSFSEIRVELETILQNFQENPQPDASN